MSIRRLGPEDAQAFRALRLEALTESPEAFGEDLSDALDKTDLDYANRLEMGDNFGAFAGGALVGILLYMREHGPKISHRAFVMSVYVQPAHRGTGAGSALVAAALDLARETGVGQVELYVSSAAPRAHAFYLREGFAEVGCSPRALCVNGCYHDERHMIRYLDPLESAPAAG
ncbi:GNAT family N-acetyltransferase [Vannielia litorea]|uniref:GNAT family N-acetyltransferase n=1 Tax=Vannielia litorea TaxID=1217970 RepID=UPI001C94E687|nr:GNAT family N-acetyltransferase [Vannielia litorea]MBY6046197.1 GNAT family N-acetyltransferase [Vannielia litorea]MBY6073610.1 GNAT family N-acetyltransferase [Vannielia litorea]